VIRLTQVQINNNDEKLALVLRKAVKVSTLVSVLFQNPLFEKFWVRPWIYSSTTFYKNLYCFAVLSIPYDEKLRCLHCVQYYQYHMIKNWNCF